MEKKARPGIISFNGNMPMQITELSDASNEAYDINEHIILSHVSAAIKAYLKAAEQLLNGKYSHLKEFAPEHLLSPGNCLIAGCPDGIVIRYEKKTEEAPKIIMAWRDEGLSQTAPLLSQNLVQCYATKNDISDSPDLGADLKLHAQIPDKDPMEIFSAKIRFDVVIEKPNELPPPPKKPFCLVSIRNQFEMALEGEMAEDDTKSPGRRFLTRTLIRFPVGWECIEVFPFVSIDSWKPEYAELWAEIDLLAAVATHQAREAHFQSLDPNNAARRQFGEILKEFRALLDSNPDREETLQVFLRNHPQLLCPVHIKMWPKLALGRHITDFIFKEAAGDYLLVELERSTHALFGKNGDPLAELNHARSQVLDWRRYIEDNLSSVQRELGLVGISSNPKALIVIGRSQILSSDNKRKLVSLENESPKTKIMTYDEVYDNAKAMIENLFGPLMEQEGTTQMYYM